MAADGKMTEVLSLMVLRIVSLKVAWLQVLLPALWSGWSGSSQRRVDHLAAREIVKV